MIKKILRGAVVGGLAGALIFTALQGVKQAFADVSTAETYLYNGLADVVTSVGITGNPEMQIFDNVNAIGARFVELPAMAKLAPGEQLLDVSDDELYGGSSGYSTWRTAINGLPGGVRDGASLGGLTNLIYNLPPYRSSASVLAITGVSPMDTESYVAAYVGVQAYASSTVSTKTVVETLSGLNVINQSPGVSFGAFSRNVPAKVEGSYSFFGPVAVACVEFPVGNGIELTTNTAGVEIVDSNFQSVDYVTNGGFKQGTSFYFKILSDQKSENVQVTSKVSTFQERLRFKMSQNLNNASSSCVIPYLQLADSSQVTNLGNLGRLGTIKIKIVDRDNSSIPLIGAVFNIKGTGLSSYDKDFTTGEDGTINSGLIPIGNYQISQKNYNGAIGSSEGYTVNSVATMTGVPYDGAITNLYLTNSIIRGQIKIQLTDSTDLPINDGCFELRSFPADKLIATGVVDGSGQLIFPNIPFGHYVIRQIYAKNGYVPAPIDANTAIMYDTEIANVIIVDDCFRGSVSVAFTDLETRDAVGSGAFGIYRADGSTYSEVSVSQPITTVSGIPAGVYTVKQLVACTGYKLNPSTYRFTIDESLEMTSLNILVSAEKGAIQYVAQSKKGVKLKGVTVDLLNSLGEVISTRVTDSNGISTFSNVKVGSYTVRSGAVPEGFVNKNTATPVEILTTGQIYVVNEVIDSVTGSIDISCIDTDSGQPLAGVVYGIYDSKTSVQIATVTSQLTPVSVQLDYGVYTAREINPLIDYASNGEVKEVKILVQDSVVDCLFSATKIKASLVVKLVKDTSEVMKGITFTLYKGNDTSGTLVSQYTTDDKGQFTTSLVAGTYALVQNNTSIDCNLPTDDVITEFAITSNSTVTVNLVNYVKRGTIALLYRDKDTGTAVPGAVFGLYDSKSDGLVAQATSTSAGYVVFSNIPYGNYYIKMLSAPPGYKFDDKLIITDSYSYTDAGKSSGPFSIFSIEKAFAASSINLNSDFVGLGGATASTAGVSTTTGSTVVGSSTVVVVSESGDLKSEVEDAAEVETKDPVTTEVVADDTTVVDAEKIKSTIVAYAKDENGNAFADVEMSLYKVSNADLSKRATLDLADVLKNATLVLSDFTTTDSSGKATFSGVNYGFYVVKQTGSVDKYAPTTSSVLTWSETDGGKEEVTIVNSSTEAAVESPTTAPDATTAPEADSSVTPTTEPVVSVSTGDDSDLESEDDTSADDLEDITDLDTVTDLDTTGKTGSSSSVSVPKTGLEASLFSWPTMFVAVLLCSVLGVCAEIILNKRKNRKK